MSFAIPETMKYVNTPGLTVGSISHTTLDQVLSYEDLPAVYGYDPDNGTVTYRVKASVTVAAIDIDFQADYNFFNGDPSGMIIDGRGDVDGALSVKVGEIGSETPSDTGGHRA